MVSWLTKKGTARTTEPGAGGGASPRGRAIAQRSWQDAGALVCSAALFYVGTGLAPVAVLAWLAPLPVFLLAPRRSARASGVVAFAASLLGTVNMWPYFLFSKPIPIPLPIAVAIVLGTSALFAGTTLVLRGLLRRGRALLAAVAAPAAWASGVYLASLAGGGMDISSASTPQTDLLPVLQVAALTGVWGVSFLVFLPASAVAALSAPAVTRGARVRAGATGLVLLVAALGYGTARLAAAASAPAPHVALVDHGRSHWESDPRAGAGSVLLQSYVDQVRELPPDVRVVVLPEAGFSATGAARPALLDPLAAVAREKNVDVVVGALDRTGGKGRWENLALLLPARGGEPVRYVKHHENGGNYRSGTELTLLRDGRLSGSGLHVCFDLNFPEPSRRYAAAGARTMLIPANDTNTDGPWHARVGVVRGVENGFSTAWSATRGAPTVSDAYGRVLAEGSTTTPNAGAFTVVSAPLPPGPGATVYTRFGDWFALLCLAITAVGVIVAVPWGKSLRASRPSSGEHP